MPNSIRHNTFTRTPGRTAAICPSLVDRLSNRVGARAALMEGLHGPTPDQPFMTPAHRRGLGLHISGPNGRTSFRRDEPYGWLDPQIVWPRPSCTPRTRRSPNTESDCARPPHRSDPRRPRVRFHLGIGDLAAPLVFRRRRHWRIRPPREPGNFLVCEPSSALNWSNIQPDLSDWGPATGHRPQGRRSRSRCAVTSAFGCLRYLVRTKSQ
jgi:hypothetical protein